MDHSHHSQAASTVAKSGLLENFKDTFSQLDFMPHGHCYLWKPGLVWTHVISDALIGLAYVSISFILYGLIKKIKLQFSTVVVCFGVFIGACGLTHFMEIWNLWYADYWWAAWVKVITAIASVGTGLYLFKLRNSIITLAESAKVAEQLQIDVMESAKILESFFESGPFLMGVAQVEGEDVRHLSDNAAAAKFFGLEPGSTKHKLSSELGTPSSVIREWIHYYKEAERTKLPQQFEYWHDGKAGKQFLSTTVSFIGISEDNFPRFSYLVQDSTHTKNIEADLLEAKNKLEAQVIERTMEFQTMANSISQLAWMTDPSGFITWYNQKWFDFTGTTLKEMQGWGWQKVHHPDHSEKVTQKWMKHLETGEPWEDTFPLRRHDGEYRWFLSRALPGRDKAGKITHWFGTNTDITDQLNIEEKLHQALVARDEFLSVASHELKTPLTALKLQAQMQLRLSEKDSEEAYSRERIDSNAKKNLQWLNRLDRLVDDMLDIARIRTGKLSLQKEEVNLCKVVRDVVERMQVHFVASSGSPIHFEGDQDSSACVDIFRMDQVVTNLLQNAIKYGKGKNVVVKVTRVQSKIVITVKDEGMGIPKDLQEKIFNRFERAVSLNEVSGLGLGLYISQEIVKAHDGDVWVESEVEKGATFFVEIPYHQKQ